MSFAKLGSQHTVNTTIAGDQNRSAVTQLLNGDIVVAWTDTYGAAINVRGQILNVDGVTRDGSEFMLNTTLTGSQYDVSLTALGNGGFAAGWTSSADWSNSPFDLTDDASQSHVVTQVFAADGDKVGGEDTHALFIYDYSFRDDYLLPDIELTDHLQGSTALTANLAVNSDDFDLIAVDDVHYTDSQLFLFTPPILTLINYEGGENNIVRFSDGDAEILNDRVHEVTYAHNVSYSVLVEEDPPGYPELDSFDNPKAITLADGTVVTAYERHSWEGTSSASWLEKEIKIDFGHGANPATVGSDYSENPALSKLNNGNIIVVWEDGDVGGGVDNIVGQLFSSGGTKIGGEFTIDSSSSNTADPAVAALTDGRFIVVWEDMAGDGSGSAIKGQVFTSGGVKSGEAFTVNTSTTDDQKYPTVTALANGDAFVTWTDYYGSTSDIYSQVLDLQTYVGDGSAETVHGGSLGDHLDGGAGADVLYGHGGNDVFENVTLDDLDDDVFDGGAGTDTLDFDDYIFIWGGPPVLLGANGTVKSVEVINLHGPTAGAGINSVELAIPLANSSSDETVTVNGALAQDYIHGERINNANISLHLNGGGGDDYLYGGAGADVLCGNDGDDVFENVTLDDLDDDVFDGGAGTDTLDLDDYVLQYFGPPVLLGANGTVTSVEVINLHGPTAGAGINSVELAIPLANSSSDETVTVNGALAQDYIHGERINNADISLHLNGGGGDDHLYGGAGGDTLDGGDDDDTLEGNGGDDELDGGDGADAMWGGTGNDIYIVDDAADVVAEYANEGIDTVDATISYTLEDQVENLALIGDGGLNGTGNDLDNAIWGSNYDNLLNGGGGVDAIKGAGGADIIDGGTGADTMLGGDGGDIFIVDDAGDVVTEAIGEGFDWLQTTVSYSLAAGSEVEVLYADPATTTAAINLIGNEFDNFLTGNDGINVLVGGLGIDTLRGSGGGDAFLWSSIDEVGLASPDIVADYSTAQGDVLHFTNIDADETQLNDQDFDFISTDAFTAPGQINWFSNGTDTFIQLNTDADLAADGMIQLSGVLSGDSVLMFL